MAVVYADLRFSRPQRDGIPESPCDDWEVTYENITPPKETQRGEEGNPPKVKGPKGFWAGYSHYVTLCFISVASLTTIIVLSVQLSLVTRQYDESSNMLEILQRDHGHLKSSLTSDIFRKESVARELQETIRKTKEELEITKDNLRESQEEGERNKQKLQSILQEKAQADITITNLRRNLQDTENQLQGKSNELSGCKNNLESAMRQKRKDNQEITNLKNALTATKRDLSTEKADLARKTEELSTVRKTLSDLQEEQEKSQLQLKKLHDLEEKMRVAKNCFFQTCDGEKNEEKSDTAAICPWGWKEIDEMCYYFSSQSNTRIKAEGDCKTKNATLAKIQESDSTLKDWIREEGKHFWIGLSKIHNEWKWSDGSIEKDLQSRGDLCAKASPTLHVQSCSSPLPWICQKKAMECRLGMENLRCFMEKINI